jgi:hypothetical protein
VEGVRRSLEVERPLHAPRRTRRHRRFLDDHQGTGRLAGHRSRGGLHRDQTGFAGCLGRGPDAQEHHVGTRDSGSRVGRERQSARCHLARHQVFEAGLMEGGPARPDHGDLLGIGIGADDVVA